MAKAKVAETAVVTGASEIASAIRDAIESGKPFTKKTVFNRKVNTPWTPKDGSPKLKLKRKAYQHGIAIPETRITNEVITLFNQLRPGSYCDGFVKVTRRKDKGIDIDYPIKTASQRLRLVNQFGVRSFAELLSTCIAEAAAPKKDVFADESE